MINIYNGAWFRRISQFLVGFVKYNLAVNYSLTHWGRVRLICVGKLTINAGILLNRPLGTNFSMNSIEMQTLLFKKMCLKVSLSKWRPFYLGLNVLIKDLSMMYRALWDRRHEGATRISQCTRRVGPSALTYPSGPWVPPISQCTIHHA